MGGNNNLLSIFPYNLILYLLLPWYLFPGLHRQAGNNKVLPGFPINALGNDSSGLE